MDAESFIDYLPASRKKYGAEGANGAFIISTKK
jgi:hypothetical protein